MQKLLKPLIDERRLKIFLDLHNPGYGTGRDLEFWCNGYQQLRPERKAVYDAFLQVVRQELVGPIRFTGDVVIGSAPTAPGAGRWVRQQSDQDAIAGTFEVPCAAPQGSDSAPTEHQLILGAELGRAIRRFLVPE